ncbi:hypothetical protein KIN20_010589 [Parelaphostrongylus tenuis]|uniref:Uncharacterized protein n=1 Tax=Parelaphostrongylus tenuis TaxID=148309 RepID=A0AAD5QLG4_PARTN|nr:hypothetical protein KIN20_010589 [Parelaphostrongylus tenuis]
MHKYRKLFTIHPADLSISLRIVDTDFVVEVEQKTNFFLGQFLSEGSVNAVKVLQIVSHWTGDHSQKTKQEWFVRKIEIL